MVRTPSPIHTPNAATDKYTETFTITCHSSTALSPRLWLSAVFWLDSSPLTYSISQGCCGQIGRLVVWLPPRQACSLRIVLFKKNATHTHTRWHLQHRHTMCASEHDRTHAHTGTVLYDSRVSPAGWACYGHCGPPSGHLSCVFYSQLIWNSMKHEKDVKE